MNYRVIAVDIHTSIGAVQVDEETMAEFATADEALDYLNYHMATGASADREVFVEDDIGIIAWAADYEWATADEGVGP